MLSDPTQEILDKQKEQIAPGVPQAEKERINGRLVGVYQNVSFLDSKSQKCHITNVRNSICSFAQRRL
jgi:hypothetical protein